VSVPEGPEQLWSHPPTSHQLTRLGCTHESCEGSAADTPEVEAVGIPAGANGGIFAELAGGVPGAGVVEGGEGVVGEVEGFAAQGGCQFRAARAVLVIPAVILPADIVKDGEEAGNKDIPTGMLGEVHGVPLDAFPVIEAVDGILPQYKACGHFLPEGFPIDLDFGGHQFKYPYETVAK